MFLGLALKIYNQKVLFFLNMQLKKIQCMYEDENQNDQETE